MLSPIKRFINVVLKKIFLLTLKPYEHLWMGKMKYLYFKRHSHILAIVFSGLDDNDKQRKYNYVKGLSKIKTIDFLFLSDPFGYRGSYYWKEQGDNAPFHETQLLIRHILNGGGYSSIITLGTSKGGSAAMLHGFAINASYILAGASQFKIGSFLAQYPAVFEGMTGNTVNHEDEQKLNDEYTNLLRQYYHSSNLILMYSTEEPTFNNHTLQLLEFLKQNNISYKEEICSFKLHGEAGAFFKPFAYNFLTNIKKRYNEN